MQPSISIIIPTYNVEEYIDQCLESALNQNLTDIEIIVVDDASTDSTINHVQKYLNQHNSKITLIENSQHVTALRCRNQGIEAARGNYIMFLDGDDYLNQNACKKALQTIKRHKTDIAMFGSIVENCAQLPQERIDSNQKFLSNFPKRTLTNNLLDACFIEKQFSFTLWNKIYKASLLKEAARDTEPLLAPKANDLYLAFITLSKAKSISFCQEKLYHYCFGRGATGRGTLDLQQFEHICKSTIIYFALERYVQHHTNSHAFEPVLQQVKCNLMSEQATNWKKRLISTQQGEGFGVLAQAWKSTATATAALANTFYDSKTYEAFESLANTPPKEIQYTPHLIQTVAIYYRNIYNGGAQRVVSNLCNLLSSESTNSGKPLKIILLTEDEPSENDFPLNSNITRITIPHRGQFPKENYEIRAKALQDIISTYHVDAFIHSMWAAKVMPWDMLAVKSHESHPAFIAHTHSVAAMLYTKPVQPLETCYAYALPEAVVSLSEADRWYWAAINNRSVHINNPLNFILSEPDKKKRENVVLWVGRFSAEKQPLEAVKIFERVKQEAPDSRLIMVGTGEEAIESKIKKEITKKNLNDSIELVGFQNNVEEYYKTAKVLLLTSEYEGFSLVFYEAASCRTPVVTYDLPYLDFYDNYSGGFFSVPQLDTSAASSIVTKLFNDDTAWRHASNNMAQAYANQLGENTVTAWFNLFDDISHGINYSEAPNKAHYAELKQIATFHYKRILSEQNKVRKLKKSNSYRAGRILTYPFRLVKQILRTKK
jgi:glycosyltransferase involved in cell wall biosynthesis